MNLHSDEPEPMKVPPHNFSKSPVKEVICQYHPSGRSPVGIQIPKPYPGWGVIQDRLTDSLNMHQNESFHGLMLTYTDEFDLFPDDKPTKLISITQEIPEILVSRMIMGPKTEITVRGDEKGTEILVRYTLKKEKIILVFQATSQVDEAYSGDATLRWFEKAREDIHQLFDVMVSETLRKRCE